jgi:hypothetical protein
MYCDRHRDIDTLDHIWSLVSYRHLKSIEASLYRRGPQNKEVSPALNVVERVSDKLRLISNKDYIHKEWVDECLQRIIEEHYHPKWDGFIQVMER